jgi:predicted  nucleic acid-binding Zn-ribbon protein
MPSIGTLFADFIARTARFDAPIQRSSRLLDRETRRMRRNSRRFNLSFRSALKSSTALKRGVAGLAGAGGLSLLIKRSLDAADSIVKVADKVGVSTDALQKWRFFTGQTADATRDLADNALQRFSRRLGEAAVGQGVLLKELERYNIAIRDSDGNTRGTIEVLKDYADVVKNAGSENEQLRLSVQAFDIEGGKLVNSLRLGREGFERYASEAERLGIILDEDAARGAARARDELDVLGRIVANNVTSAVVALAPVIANLAAGMKELAPRVREAVDAIAEFFGITNLQSAENLKAQLADVNAEITALQEKFGEEQGKTFVVDEFLGIGETRSKRLNEINDQLLELGQRRLALNEALKSAEARERALNDALANRPSIGSGTSGGGTGAASTIDELDRALEDLTADLDPAGAAIADYRDKHNTLWQALQAQKIAFPEYQELVAELNKRFVESSSEIAEAADSVETFNQEIEQTPDRIEETTDALKDAGREFENLGDRAGSTFADIVTGANSAADALGNLQNFILRRAAEFGFSAVEDLVLQGIGSLGGFFGGSTAVQGLSQSAVTTLNSSALAAEVGGSSGAFNALRTSLPGGIGGFHEGGGVTGGIPGRDSVLAALTPGEFVLRAAVARQLGEPLLRQLNEEGPGALSRFADGGLVMPASPSVPSEITRLARGEDESRPPRKRTTRPQRVRLELPPGPPDPRRSPEQDLRRALRR